MTKSQLVCTEHRVIMKRNPPYSLMYFESSIYFYCDSLREGSQLRRVDWYIGRIDK